MKAQSAPHKKSGIDATEKHRQQQRYSIILVDDDSDIVHALKLGLEVNSFQVDGYSSPREALEAFKPDVYDFAILDIRMPGLNGFQLYRQMKKLDPTITACFLSAFEVHPSEFQIMFPFLQKVKAIIKKPISVNDLLMEITPFLRGSALARAVRGEHFLVAFEPSQQLIDQSLQYLKIGLLENDEDILLVTDELTKKAIRESTVKEWNVDVRSLETNGRITLMTFHEWHLIEDMFDIKRSKTMMTKMVRKALDRGRKGFRLVGDMNPFFSKGMAHQLVALESSLEKQFDLPITTMCAYTKENIDQHDNSTIVALQQHHNRTMIEEGEGGGTTYEVNEAREQLPL